MPVPVGGTSVGDLPGVPEGSYLVTYLPPAGFQLTGTPNSQSPRTVVLVPDQIDIETFACAPIPVATATGISGIVSLGSGQAVGGGTIEVFNGPLVINTIAIAVDGTYSITIVAGTYTLRLHPHHGYSIKVGEPDTKTVTVTTGTTPAVDFMVTQALFYDDFQTYADSAALRNNFGNTTTTVQSTSNRPLITLDATAGPDGKQTMRYDWPAFGIAQCGPANPLSDYYLYIGFNFKPPRPIRPDIWIRVLDRVTNPFTDGNAACTSGRGYKYFVAGFGTAARVLVQLTGNNSSHNIQLDMEDKTAAHYQVQAKTLGPNTVWTAGWNTWLISIIGIGTTSCAVKVYFNGVVLNSVSGTFIDTISNEMIGLELGANLNNGPDTAQHRWFREVGIYGSRPSMLLGV